MLLPMKVPCPEIPQEPSTVPTPLISQFWMTVPVTPLLIWTTAQFASVILQFSIVTFGALIYTLPLMSRPEITVPACVITRSPDGVSVTPAGTPVFVASGHPLLGVVVAKAISPCEVYGSFTRPKSHRESEVVSTPLQLRFRYSRWQEALLRRHLDCAVRRIIRSI